jgi:hypothetical protein
MGWNGRLVCVRINAVRRYEMDYTPITAEYTPITRS